MDSPSVQQTHRPRSLLSRLSETVMVGVVRGVFAFSRAIGPERSGAIGAAHARWIGPLLKAHRTALANIRAAYPEKSEAEVNQFLAGFANFRVLVDGQPPAHSWADVLPTARRCRVSVPHAEYLELAARLALPLATINATLTRAAAAAGVPIFTP